MDTFSKASLEACQLIPLFSPQESDYFKDIVGYIYSKKYIFVQ